MFGLLWPVVPYSDFLPNELDCYYLKNANQKRASSPKNRVFLDHIGCFTALKFGFDWKIYEVPYQRSNKPFDTQQQFSKKQ